MEKWKIDPRNHCSKLSNFKPHPHTQCDTQTVILILVTDTRSCTQTESPQLQTPGHNVLG